jgi:spoIIIJ-associated protein
VPPEPKKAITMEWVETTGRTIAEALDAALDELGVDEEDVEYEVLEEPKSGFLGRIGSSEGRIRARVKPISREKPGERQRRKGRGSSRPRNDAPRGNGDRGNGASRNGGARADGPAGETAGAGASNRRRRGGRGGGGGAGRGNDGGSGSTSGSGSSRNKEQQGSTVETTERDVPIEEQAEAAEVFTQGLVDTFELGARAKSVIDDDVVVVEVTGENLGLLVGPKGATLHAIEELVRTVVQRQTDGHGVRIHVDVAGYRAKRREALADFTRSLAEKVIETGRVQALEPMSASDRKVVHDTAAEIDGVATESEGEDPRRRVVLRPS